MTARGRLAGVELGGTKTIALLADGEHIVERVHWRSIADDLAELMATLFLTASVRRILLGGTVMTK